MTLAPDEASFGVDVTPRYGDSDVVLLTKIVSALSTRFSAPELAPKPLDSMNQLLSKWAALWSLYLL